MTDDAAGIVKWLRSQYDRQGMIGHSTAADLIKRLSAQLAESRALHSAMCKESDELAALVFKQGQQLAERDAELAEERKHAEAMADDIETETDLPHLVRAYRVYRG